MVTTPITTDTTPPSAPTNFTATAVSASPFSYGYIELSWLGSTDSGSTDTSASGYKVYRGGNVISEIGSVRTLTNANTINFTASEGYLQPATTYTYFVVAYDAAGNVSAPSNSASATTLSTSTPTPTPVTSSVNFNNFSRNLAMGSIGNDVKQLQALLANEVGYSANLITGYFGRITRDAVKRLQEKYGVKPVSGYFGEITRKTLIKN